MEPTAEDTIAGGGMNVSVFAPPPPVDKSRLILLKPHKAQADIWEHFSVYGTIEGGADERDPFVGREALEARVRRLAVCNYCSVEINRGSSLSTTPLWNHFKKKHCELYDEAKGGIQVSGRARPASVALDGEGANVDVLSGHGRSSVVGGHHTPYTHPSSKQVCRRGSRCGWNLDQTKALVDEAVKMHIWAVPHGQTEEGWDSLAGELSKSHFFTTCGGIRGLGAKRKYKELVASYKATGDGKDGRPIVMEGSALKESLEKNRAMNDPTQDIDATVNNIVLGIQMCVKGREAQKMRRRPPQGGMKTEMGNIGPWALSSNAAWPSVAAAVAAASSSQPLPYSGVVMPHGYGGDGVTDVRGGGGGTAPTRGASLFLLAGMVKRLHDSMIEENKKVESVLDQMGAKLDNITRRLGH